MRHTDIILMTSDDNWCALHAFDRRGPSRDILCASGSVRVTLDVQLVRISALAVRAWLAGVASLIRVVSRLNDIDQRVIKLLIAALVVEASSN